MNTTQNATTITAEPGTPFLDVVRELDAPPELVFRAHTDAELVAQWMGPGRYKMTVDQWDARTGGGYRFTHRSADMEAGFRGVFHTVAANRTIIQTFEWDGMPDDVILETLRFEDLGGRTRLVGRSVFGSVELRDGAVEGGMTDGMKESYDRLETLVGTLDA